MLVKWITCRVVDRAAFHHGQRAWAQLSGHPGLLTQLGGWSRREDDVAHIFSCWADRASYESFPQSPHDPVATGQAGTCQALTVRLFDHRLTIGAGIPADLADAALIRLAHCHVRARRQAHFIRTQAEIWNPGMVAAAGMRGGVFAQRADAEFLVLSLWRSSTDHERYFTNRFPGLQQRSDVANDLESVAGDLIDLEPSWLIT